MTKTRETKLVQQFLKWLKSTGCKVTTSSVPCRKTIVKICSAVRLGKDGKPLDTLCYEVLPDSYSKSACWLEILKRRCEGKLLFDKFGLLGLSDASTLEELELKLAICEN